MGVLHVRTPVRNACAHHSRLWNRRLPMTMPHIKRHKASLVHPSAPRHQAHYLYNYLSVMGIMMRKMNPNGTWRTRVVKLIEEELEPQFLLAMGFPQDWQQRSVWDLV